MNHKANQSTLCLEIIEIQGTQHLTLAKYHNLSTSYYKEKRNYELIQKHLDEAHKDLFVRLIGCNDENMALYLEVGPLTTLGDYCPKTVTEVHAIVQQIENGIDFVKSIGIYYSDANINNFIVDASKTLTTANGNFGPKVILIDFAS